MDIAAARIRPTVPAIQPKGTIIDPEYPRTYALFTPVVRINPTWYQGSGNDKILTGFSHRCKNLRIKIIFNN
jgi:hypothetical protein